MITAGQLRAAARVRWHRSTGAGSPVRACFAWIQRMEASEGLVRGTVSSLMKLIGALVAVGIELIAEGAFSEGGGRGLRLRSLRGDQKPYRHSATRLTGPRAA
jgi:hypothetical protein